MTSTTRPFGSVAIGDELPPLEVHLSRTLIVATAIASRDYQDVHHDHVKARDRGSQDIFMNILTTNGFVGRFVTDWAGPGAVLTDVNIRLGAPNYADDTMVLTGTVSSVEASGGGHGRGAVEISVRGANSLGDHVTGTVRLLLPTADADAPAGAGAVAPADAAAPAGATTTTTTPTTSERED